jgi:hypothetical protein
MITVERTKDSISKHFRRERIHILYMPDESKRQHETESMTLPSVEMAEFAAKVLQSLSDRELGELLAQKEFGDFVARIPDIYGIPRL